MTSFLVPVYATYLTVAVGLVIWLARTLFHNGAVFLDDVFDDHRMAEAVNRLLVIGFYMANLGYASYFMKAESAASGVEAFEVLSQKLGVLLLSMAALHFTNLYVFHRVRRRATAPLLPPPVRPQVHLPAKHDDAWARVQ